MTDWLFQKDNYEPKNDKDYFIDKTIISLLGMLSKMHREDSYSSKFIYKINAVIKLIFTLAIIIAISISRSYLYVLIVGSYLLIMLLTLEKNAVKKILIVSSLIPFFTLIMLIPSMITGNMKNSNLLLLKLFCTIMSINMLSYTTKWHHLTKALKVLFIPDIFILVFDITIKYIYILGEFSLSMIYALKLRSVGKNNKKFTSISKIMGILFLKSKELGDEMYSAMECRGFTGEYTAFSSFKFTYIEMIYTLLNFCIIALYFYIRKM